MHAAQHRPHLHHKQLADTMSGFLIVGPVSRLAVVLEPRITTALLDVLTGGTELLEPSALCFERRSTPVEASSFTVDQQQPAERTYSEVAETGRSMSISTLTSRSIFSRADTQTQGGPDR